MPGYQESWVAWVTKTGDGTVSTPTPSVTTGNILPDRSIRPRGAFSNMGVQISGHTMTMIMIVGIAVLALVFATFVFCCIRRHKKKAASGPA